MQVFWRSVYLQHFDFAKKKNIIDTITLHMLLKMVCLRHFVFSLQTFFGCEYMGPGKTALELLVDFYVDITRYSGGTQGNEVW